MYERCTILKAEKTTTSDKTTPCNQSELIRRCTSLVGETDALLELMAAGQEQLASLEMRVKRIEMKLASCR